MWDMLEQAMGWAAPALDQAARFLLTRPSGETPLAAMLLVPLAALGYYVLRKPRQMRRFRLRRMARFVLSMRYLKHRSHVLDVMLMAGNIGLFALIVGEATLSMTGVAALVYGGLTQVFGAVDGPAYNSILVGVTWAVALFLAYEFAYWIDHYLSHNISVLWEFHKVHHTAEVLSPLTNFRVHPVDSLVFMNIIALCNGATAGVLHWLFGAGPVKLEIFNHTTMIALAVTVFAQLQHTHIWIAFTGVWGRLILSPAHHQIHHSIDTRHHNKNLGNLIAVFDWAFGTLYVPSKKRQKLVFGLSGAGAPAHDLHEGLVQPFSHAAQHIVPQPAAGRSPA